MPLLGSSIVKHELASAREVEQAIVRQSAYGGDLLTNLLELTLLPEERVLALLAEAFALDPAPAGELPRASEEVRRLVPGEVAQRFGCVPLEERPGSLVLAVSEPLPAEVEGDMAFALGVNVVQVVAPLVRIRQAIARDYGIPLEPRMGRALARLEGRPDPNPSVHPPGRSFGERPPTLAPPGEPASPSPPRSGPTPDLANLMRGEATRSARPRRIGPYTAAMAETDLLAASSRDEVLRVFFDFAAQYFEYAALFVVHGDLAEGRDAHGPGAQRTKVQSIGIELDLPSALSRARDAASHELARLGSGLDLTLAKDLERRPGPEVLLLPVRVRGRTVLILYGDHGESDVTLAQVGDVISFSPLVAAAVERVIMLKKRGGRPEPTLGSSPAAAPRPKQPLPSPEERAEALVTSLTSSPPNRVSRTPPLPPIAFSDEPPPQPAPSEKPAPAPSRAPAARAASGPFARPVISVGVPSRPAIPAATPFARPEPAQGHAIDRRTPLPAAPVSDDSPDISVGAVEDDEAPTTLVSEDHASAPPPDAFDAPSSRTDSHSARPLPARGDSSELRLPTVIVDVSRDLRGLLTQLLAGSASAGDKLVEAGAAAVPVLAAAFPGPIETPPSRRGTVVDLRASDSGPILKTIARIGSKALPYVIVRTNDADPTVRSWATRLLGEMPSLDSALAIARRFFDADLEVRRSALAAARLLGDAPEALEALIAELGGTAEDRGKPTGVRLTAMEILADLRQPQAVSHLLRTLTDNPIDVVQAARRALSIISRQDLGVAAAAWAEWWRVNGSRHRIEWLIDALTHDAPEIRRAAGEELKGLTREYFGYYDDLPPSERARAQNKYREWWDSRGKGRFRAR